MTDPFRPNAGVYRDIPQDPGCGDSAASDPTPPMVRGINDIPRACHNDEAELIRHRFLCRGGGALLIGPTGIGKSSLTMQLNVSFALGRPVFGLVPTRPMRVLLVQAENDDGDLAEMRDGVLAGMGLMEDERTRLNEMFRVVTEDTRSGGPFLDFLDELLTDHPSELAVLDPVFSFLGCDAINQEGVTSFLRLGLNPILHRHGCAGLLVHHTNKPNAGQNRNAVRAGDNAYLGAGSAEFSNWARAVIALKSIGRSDVFELRLGKRGERIGWKEADGIATKYSKQIAHSPTPGEIFWHEVTAEDEVTLPVVSRQNPGSPTKGDILKLVPAEGRIPKHTLITQAKQTGVGEGKAKKLINELLDNGLLVKIFVPRSGMRPSICLARPHNHPPGEFSAVDTDGLFAHPEARSEVKG